MLIQTSLPVWLASKTMYSQEAPAGEPPGVVCCSALVGRIRSDHAACGLLLVSRKSTKRRAEKYFSRATNAWLKIALGWWPGRMTLTFLTPPACPVNARNRFRSAAPRTTSAVVVLLAAV